MSAVGPFPALTMLLLFPIVFAIPVAAVVARLSVAYPDDGGYVIWVKHAFVRGANQLALVVDSSARICEREAVGLPHAQVGV